MTNVGQPFRILPLTGALSEGRTKRLVATQGVGFGQKVKKKKHLVLIGAPYQWP